MRNPQQTQHRLIEVAASLMADLGAAGLRVDQVAALAKINKRMIYHYFGDKEGLTAKVIAQQVAAITPILKEQEANTLLRLFDDAALANTDVVLFAEQPSTQAQQQAAVIVMRALLDRWRRLSETAEHPMQSLLSSLSALTLGLAPQPAHAVAPAATSLQPLQKERFSLRPTVSLIQASP